MFDIKHRINRWMKPRFSIIYPFLIMVLFLCSSDEQSLKAGIGFIMAGVLLRLWSNGYAIKNDKLTTSGPYAFVRNPLYLGTFLIVLGFVIVLKMLILGIFLLIALILQYYKTIKGEEQDLTARYGDKFKHYCQKVHAMIPGLNPYTEGEKWPFSLERLMFSKEYKTVVWVITLLVFFHLKSRIFLEQKEMTLKGWILVGLCGLLILFDLYMELTKKSRSKS